ncbi:hypothetical protein LLE49_07540 [Alicyclobacillus tolerans]|uniref:hypothetical protein n=1 Tax=Alicyclobacillus tolerans TaxID=90970 RepID=UPI001F224195|nr:hypothetical protein [Alicyclobacillus tolerans]MCF8564597.1 hypothetical protein [Alicyclobacillus tolerans]
MAETRKNAMRMDRTEILQSEWTVLIGESLVAIGSVVVVIGLIRAFHVLLKDHRV